MSRTDHVVPLAARRTSAWSQDGHVEVVLLAGQVQQINMDPAWRTTQPEQVVEHAVVEATNQALNQHQQQIYTVLHHRPPTTGLAAGLRRAANELTGDDRHVELPGAVRELVNVLNKLEDDQFVAEVPAPLPPPAHVDVTDDGSSTQVHVTGGVVQHLGLDTHWSRCSDDAEFTERLRTLINRGLDQYRTAQLEMQLATPVGQAGLASAVWEANAYVASAQLMDLDRFTEEGLR